MPKKHVKKANEIKGKSIKEPTYVSGTSSGTLGLPSITVTSNQKFVTLFGSDASSNLVENKANEQ